MPKRDEHVRRQEIAAHGEQHRLQAAEPSPTARARERFHHARSAERLVDHGAEDFSDRPFFFTIVLAPTAPPAPASPYLVSNGRTARAGLKTRVDPWGRGTEG